MSFGQFMPSTSLGSGALSFVNLFAELKAFGEGRPYNGGATYAARIGIRPTDEIVFAGYRRPGWVGGGNKIYVTAGNSSEEYSDISNPKNPEFAVTRYANTFVGEYEWNVEPTKKYIKDYFGFGGIGLDQQQFYTFWRAIDRGEGGTGSFEMTMMHHKSFLIIFGDDNGDVAGYASADIGGSSATTGDDLNPAVIYLLPAFGSGAVVPKRGSFIHLRDNPNITSVGIFMFGATYENQGNIGFSINKLFCDKLEELMGL